MGSRSKKLLEVAELAKNHNVHVRFIEMMPIGMGTQFAFVKEDALKHALEEAFGTFYPVRGRGRKWLVPLFRSPWLSGTDRFYQRGQP